MAKLRFPGKALKLNYRKRVRFREDNAINYDESRILRIKSGLILFNQLFGDSDECDDVFEGFSGQCVQQSSPHEWKETEPILSSQHEWKETESFLSGSSDKEDRIVIPIEKQKCFNVNNSNVSKPSFSKKSVILDLNHSSQEDVSDNKVLPEEFKKEVSKPLKKQKETSERTARKFVLPVVSARSSRIIKPNTKFSQDISIFSKKSLETCVSKANESQSVSLSVQSQRLSKINNVAVSPINADEETESDPVCRSITFYTDSITEEFKGHVGRPSKRLLRKGDSPNKPPKEDRVKEKIEKLLRSPWSNRMKQNAKGLSKEKDSTTLKLPFNSATLSKSILRKAKLNLNKRTLQKIRSPSSIQSLVTVEEDTSASKCGLCLQSGCSTINRCGVSCCESCHNSLSFFTESLGTHLDCLGGQGECQLVGLSAEERCTACWLCRLLHTCTLPSLLHDRLRKYLPLMLKEKVPTSLSRSFNCNVVIPLEDSPADNGFIGFGSLVDLPGGWKRKNGTEVVVISPSGEKFKSVLKLEEYLRRQGINVQANVLFGNRTTTKDVQKSDTETNVKQSTKVQSKLNNIVVTTLPGGWARRIKWRGTGDRFDTYVCSPDGRTFRSRKELRAYFQHIGKIDDIHKYFPVKNSKASVNSSDNSEASSTEPMSSSEGSIGRKSPEEPKSEVIDNSKKLRVCSSTLPSMKIPITLSTKREKSDTVIINNFNQNISSNEPEKLSDDNFVSSIIDDDNDKIPSVELSSLSEREDVVSNVEDLSDCQEKKMAIDRGKKHRKKKSSKHKKSNSNHYHENDKEAVSSLSENKKLIFKVNKDYITSMAISTSSGDSSKSKKKKRKHSKPEIKTMLDGHSSSLVFDVDKISPKVTEDNENIAGSDVPDDIDTIVDSNNLGSHQPQTSSDVDVEDIYSDVPCHPNDTWQTLICKPKVDPLMNQTETVTEVRTTVVENRPKRLPVFTTESFGNGWCRKIKWNEDGQGKVTFLTSPQGQRIVSSIELMAYFKKAGSKMLRKEYYFPKDLVRKTPEEKCIVIKSKNEETSDRLQPPSALKELVERKKRERSIILFSQSKLKFQKSLRKAKLKSFKKGWTNIRSCDPGPRVKNVCRSQAQVLGMPRAVFPSPEKGKFLRKKKKRVYTRNKLKMLSLPKNQKLFTKTLWCHKCAGCKTPDCRKCVSCLDMKKYGGPGTKKKSCMMRKCYNPIRALKSVSQIPPKFLSELSDEISESRKAKEDAADDSDFSGLSDSVSEFTNCNELLNDRKNVDRRSIFVPKVVKPTEAKDKGDVQSGKEFIPGTRLNIDYWQAYDAEEMLTSGFPIITSVPLQIDSFCFRCGSAGLEELLYCIWCCEGVHPFCLEEGEGPESDEEEAFWVCKRCAVCHVCGAAAHYDLLQCNGCRRHFHLECLGPASHVMCQPSVDDVWDTHPLRLLSFSWPMQPPLIELSDFEEFSDLGIELLEDLSPMGPLFSSCEDIPNEFWECCFLPSAMTKLPNAPIFTPEKMKDILVESIHIEETFADLEEEDHICLEEELGDIKQLSSSTLTDHYEVVNFVRGIDLFNRSDSPKMNDSKMASMVDDEYLTLGYKKILPFHEQKRNTSLSRILQLYLIELFDILGFEKVWDLKDKGWIPESYFEEPEFTDPVLTTTREAKKMHKEIHSTAMMRSMEAKRAYQNALESQNLKEKKEREITREKHRKRKSDYTDADYDGEDFVKCPRVDYQSTAFINYHEDDDDSGNTPYEEKWQPQSWEEFDAMFSITGDADDDQSVSPSLLSAPILKRKSSTKGSQPKRKKSIAFTDTTEKSLTDMKLMQCSVKVTPLEKEKWKPGREFLSPLKQIPQKQKPKSLSSEASHVAGPEKDPTQNITKKMKKKSVLSDQAKQPKKSTNKLDKDKMKSQVYAPENSMVSITKLNTTDKNKNSKLTPPHKTKSKGSSDSFKPKDKIKLVNNETTPEKILKSELSSHSKSSSPTTLIPSPNSDLKSSGSKDKKTDQGSSMLDVAKLYATDKIESLLPNAETKLVLESTKIPITKQNMESKPIGTKKIKIYELPVSPSDKNPELQEDQKTACENETKIVGERFSTRAKRTSSGRASELASLRKAMWD